MDRPVAVERKLTPEEFDVLYAGKRYEYVDGQAVPMSEEILDENGAWIVAPTLGIHGLIVHETELPVGQYVRENDLGYVFGAETYIVLNRDPLVQRAADVAFVAKGRVKSVRELFGKIPFAPDLVVEVISENDKAEAVKEKINHYMKYGVRLLWVLYPKERQIEVHRPGQPILTLDINDTLDGGDVLSGFSVPVKQIFKILDDEEAS